MMVAGALAVTTAVSVGAVSAPAIGATTKQVVSAASTDELLAAVNDMAFPVTASTVVAVQPGSDALLAEATALASAEHAPIVIAASGTDDTSVRSAAEMYAAPSVTLYGTGDYFTQAYQDDLASHVTLTTSTLSNNALDRARAVLGMVAVPRIVFADSSSALDQRLAANDAIGRGAALAVLNGSEAADDITAFITDKKDTPVTLVGDVASQDFSFPDGESNGFTTMPVNDPVATELAQAEEQTTNGAQANDLYVAPNDQLPSVVLNAYLARASGGVSMTAGPAATITAASAAVSDIKLLAAETSGVHLVGINVTSAQLASLTTQTATARRAAPAWRFTGASVTSGTFKVTWTALTGAASYKGYDILGNQVISATKATSATVTGGAQDIVIAGINSAGKEIGRLEFTANELASPEDAESAAISSTKDGSGDNYIQFLGKLRLPRVITRTMTDPMKPTAAPVVSTIAVTCQSFFDDKGDPTKQYEYEVRTQGGADNVACKADASRYPTTIQAIESSKVTVPMTTYPTVASTKATSFRSMSQVESLQSKADVSHAAAPSTQDSELMSALGKTTGQSTYIRAALPQATTTAAKAAAAAGPNYAIQYSAFIKENRIPGPFPYSFNKQYPYVQFAGDNRGLGIPNGAHRVQATMKFMFQNSPQTVVLERNVGLTTRYNCTKKTGGTCVVDATARASENGITWAPHISGSVATATLAVKVADPLIPHAPAINTGLYFRLQPGHSTIQGSHDRMPAHEIDSGIIPGDYSVRYTADEGPLYCLWGFVPSCTVHVNRSL